MLYVDVDAVSKLAHWNMLPLLPEMFGRPWSAMATVSSLVHRAHRAVTQPDGKLFRTPEAASVAKAALEQMAPCGEADDELLAVLSRAPNIDPGEAILLSLTAQSKAALILTGDKKALRGLAATPVAKQFCGRVVILEQLLRFWLVAKGRTWLLANVCPGRDADKAISIILGSSCNASQGDIESGLTSYIGEIDKLISPTFLHAVSAA